MTMQFLTDFHRANDIGIPQPEKEGIEYSIANGASVNLADGPGLALIKWGNVDACRVQWTVAGVPTIIWSMDVTPLCVTTDTAGKLCHLDGGTCLTLKNRYGSDLVVTVTMQ